MDDERSKRVEEMFQRAADMPADQRERFLRERCGSDSRLRREVETLLRHEIAAPPAFLRGRAEETMLAADSGPVAPPLVGKQVGRYRLLRVIASGGMGTVYEARQERPRRTVALKMLKFGLASPSAMHRFAHEAEILGRLQHPNIAQIYEAGTHEDAYGRVPFFAMEYIAGAKAITDYAHDLRLSTNLRLELFAEVCDAVSHGHQKGIIHRDLKPSNIQVDPSGHPKVIDFGIARATEADMTIATLQTDVGQLVGTLQYMSPEQCAGDSSEIDTRSDVYALGVVLYELLAGRLPYDLTTPSLFEIPRIIREETPRKLSAINRTLRGDVQTIVLKALEKDRERRYQSADDLARDIRHYLAGEPIEAKRDSTLYVLRKHLWRHRNLVAVATGFVLLLIASSVVAWTLYVGSQNNLWESYLAQARAGRQTGRPGHRLDCLEVLAKAAAIRPSIELRNEAIACLALTDLRAVKRIDTGFASALDGKGITYRELVAGVR